MIDQLRNFFRLVRQHLIITVLVAIGALATFYYLKTMKENNQANLTPPLSRGDIVLSVYGIGTLMANHSFSLKVGVIGTVSDLYIKEGDAVVKGQKLAKIDRQVYQAPFAGTVTSLAAMIGENVFQQIPVLTVVDLRDRYLAVSLEQQGALRVRPQQKVKINFDSLRAESYSGTVTSIYSSNGVFIARIDIADFPEKFLPGMTADIAIILEEHKNALLVPVSAIEGNQVYLKSKVGLLNKIPVKVGIVDGAFAEILEGDIHEGDRLLIRKKMGP